MGYCPPPLRPLPEDLSPRRAPPDEEWPPHLRDDEDAGRQLRLFTMFGWLFAFCALLEAMTACGVIQCPFKNAEKPAVRAEVEGE